MYAAIYAWKVIPGRDERFRAGWRRVTEALFEQRGSFGSRLHRAADGRVIAYALWPDEETWKAAMAGESLDPEGIAMMHDSAEPDGDELPDGRRSPVIGLGDVIDDLLHSSPKSEEPED